MRISALKIQYKHSVTKHLNYREAEVGKCWLSPNLLKEKGPVVLKRIRITGSGDPK